MTRVSLMTTDRFGLTEHRLGTEEIDVELSCPCILEQLASVLL